MGIWGKEVPLDLFLSSFSHLVSTSFHATQPSAVDHVGEPTLRQEPCRTQARKSVCLSSVGQTCPCLPEVLSVPTMPRKGTGLAAASVVNRGCSVMLVQAPLLHQLSLCLS